MTKDKIIGMFLGIAIGDALGMPVEKMTAEEISRKYGRITDYLATVDHPWHGNVPAGTWTDDTRLTLAVAESLIGRNGFDMDDIAQKHIEAFQSSARSDWGGTTREAIQRLIQGVHWSESAVTGPKRGFGNGVVMKIAPLGAYFASAEGSIFGMLEMIRNFTFMTHKTSIAMASAVVHSLAVADCLILNPKEFSGDQFVHESIMRTGAVLDPTLPGDDLRKRLAKLEGINKNTSLKEISDKFPGNPFSIDVSIPVSYAAFLKYPKSIEAIYDAVALGGDTDSNASIAGGLLGALNGTNVFPEHLIDGICDKETIIDVAERFCQVFNIR
jgi:ADP-ribosylglycohydrolase